MNSKEEAVKNYVVYFEFFGRKMKTEVLAKSKQDAENQIKNRIKFHKVEIDENDDFNKAVDFIDKFLDILGKK